MNFHSSERSVADNRLDRQGKMPTMSTVTVKVDGRPVEAVVSEQIADEIQEVRESENDFKIRKSARTKRCGNHSGERTQAGYSMYLGDPKTTHVFAQGAFWPKEPKFPAEPAGFSAYGMCEFCESTQEFKCHECAKWVGRLDRHIREHKEAIRDYKIKFGLPLKVGIVSPATKEAQKLHAKAIGLSRPGGHPRGSRFNAVIVRKAVVASKALRLDRSDTRQSPGRDNVRRMCRAQTLTDFKELYTAIGRTPRANEMENYINCEGFHSLTYRRIRTLFESRAGFFACAGVPMRKRGVWANPESRAALTSRRNKDWWASASCEDRAALIEKQHVAQRNRLQHSPVI